MTVKALPPLKAGGKGLGKTPSANPTTLNPSGAVLKPRADRSQNAPASAPSNIPPPSSFSAQSGLSAAPQFVPGTTSTQFGPPDPTLAQQNPSLSSTHQHVSQAPSSLSDHSQTLGQPMLVGFQSLIQPNDPSSQSQLRLGLHAAHMQGTTHSHVNSAHGQPAMPPGAQLAAPSTDVQALLANRADCVRAEILAKFVELNQIEQLSSAYGQAGTGAAIQSASSFGQGRQLNQLSASANDGHVNSTVPRTQQQGHLSSNVLHQTSQTSQASSGPQLFSAPAAQSSDPSNNSLKRSRASQMYSGSSMTGIPPNRGQSSVDGDSGALDRILHSTDAGDQIGLLSTYVPAFFIVEQNVVIVCMFQS